MADVDVTLGLDSKQLHSELSGVKGTLDKFASSTKGALTGLASGFLAGFSINAIKDTVTQLVNYGSSVQDLSDKLGVSASTLNKFGNAAALNGASLESVGKAFQFLEKNREKALGDPDGPQAKAFEGLGISIQDLESMNAEQIMLKIGESSMNAADMITVLGKSALDLRSTLANIADGFQKLGDGPDDATFANLDALGDKFQELSQKGRDLALTFLNEVFPTIASAQSFFAKPFEAATRAMDNTPLGASAAPEDSALAAQLHSMRERQAGTFLPPEIADRADIKDPSRPEHRRFDEADSEAAGDELDVIGADFEAKQERRKEEHDEEERQSKAQESQAREARNEASRKERANQKLGRLDEEFNKNPAGLTLEDMAQHGALGNGAPGTLARKIQQEEARARSLQLAGNKRGAAEAQGRAEKLKKELGLPSKEDQKDAIKNGLDESENIRKIKENTDNLGSNR